MSGCEDRDPGGCRRPREQGHVVLPVPGCGVRPRSRPSPEDAELCHPGPLSPACPGGGRRGQIRQSVDKRNETSPGWRDAQARQSVDTRQGWGAWAVSHTAGVVWIVPSLGPAWCSQLGLAGGKPRSNCRGAVLTAGRTLAPGEVRGQGAHRACCAPLGPPHYDGVRGARPRGGAVPTPSSRGHLTVTSHAWHSAHRRPLCPPTLTTAGPGVVATQRLRGTRPQQGGGQACSRYRRPSLGTRSLAPSLATITSSNRNGPWPAPEPGARNLN